MYPFSVLASLGTAAISGFKIGGGVVAISYGAVIPILAALPRVSHRIHGGLRSRVNEGWVTAMERLSFAAILLNAPGSLYFHDAGIQYDRVIHFGCAMLLYLILLYAVVPFLDETSSANKGKILMLVFTASMVGLFIWEILQYSLDRIFDTRVFFDAGQPIDVDVTEDILFGLFGLLTVFAYTAKSKTFWQKLVAARRLIV